jgi:hypothetical protein
MAGFFSKIFSAFGSGNADAASPAASTAEPEIYGDFAIYPTPLKEGSQFRLAGRIEKTVNGEVLTHNFVRADVFTSLDDANEFTIRKAKVIIDQSGATLFTNNGHS